MQRGMARASGDLNAGEIRLLLLYVDPLYLWMDNGVKITALVILSPLFQPRFILTFRSKLSPNAIACFKGGILYCKIPIKYYRTMFWEHVICESLNRRRKNTLRRTKTKTFVLTESCERGPFNSWGGIQIFSNRGFIIVKLPALKGSHLFISFW